MKNLSTLAAGLALSLGLAGPAFAQTDFLTVAKIACAPDSVTRCEGPGKCKTEPASADDKSEVLVLDFGAKTAAIRKGADTKQFGVIISDKVEGDMRKFAMGEAGKGDADKLEAVLTKAGKLSLLIGNDGSKADATCTAG